LSRKPRAFRSERLLEGGIAGGAATIAMTAVMFVLQRGGWLGTMPPRLIVERCLRWAGTSRQTARRVAPWASIPAHLGFGMGQGALFAALLELRASSRLTRAASFPRSQEGSPSQNAAPLVSSAGVPWTTGGDKPTVPSAVAFALAVWAVSYSGWIPALDIMRPPGKDRPGRPTAMIVSHLVFGVVLGLTLRRMFHVRRASSEDEASGRFRREDERAFD
jgi:hypothetical protein